MKTITIAVLLSALTFTARAEHKPKEYPLHGKITSTGRMFSGSGYGYKGVFSSETGNTVSVTATDGMIFKIAGCGTFNVFTRCGPSSQEDRPFPKMGEKVDFRTDSKQNHLYIHWIKIACTLKTPCTANVGDGGGEKKDLETEYDIIEVTAPPSAQ